MVPGNLRVEIKRVMCTDKHCVSGSVPSTIAQSWLRSSQAADKENAIGLFVGFVVFVIFQDF